VRWFFDNAVNIQAIFELVLTIAGVVGIVFMVWLRRSTPSRTEMVTAIATAIGAALAPVLEKLTGVDRNALEALGRVARVEVTIDRHATKDDVSEILQALQRQDGDRRALGAQVQGMRDGFARIEDQLRMLMEEALRK
jgi:glyceraldehyde-3-phosphate dehydrogenase/erythrose-4-phosphate dehydrogenase